MRREPAKPRGEAADSRYHFVIAELELGITFCRLAVDTADKQKADRNLQNAEKAYLSASHFLKSVALSTHERDTVQGRMDRLFDLLAEARDRKQFPASSFPASSRRKRTRSTVTRVEHAPLARRKTRRHSILRGHPE